MKPETIKYILDEWLKENWHLVWNNNLEIHLSYGRDTYTIDNRGYSRTDEHGIEYLMSELSNFDREIICRMLPDFKKKINDWVECA